MQATGKLGYISQYLGQSKSVFFLFLFSQAYISCVYLTKNLSNRYYPQTQVVDALKSMHSWALADFPYRGMI